MFEAEHDEARVARDGRQRLFVACEQRRQLERSE